MKNSMTLIIGLLTIMFIFVNTGVVNAVVVKQSMDLHEITLESAEKTAIANTLSIRELDQKIMHLLTGVKYNPKNYKGLKEDVNEEISELHLKANNFYNISSMELGILYGYYAMFGNTSYFKGKDISNIFNPSIYPNYSVWSNLLRYEFKKKAIANNVSLRTREIYDGIISLQDQIRVSNTSLQLTQKAVSQEEKKYKQGQVSKINLEISKLNLEIQTKELNKLNRSLENLSYDLKKLLGIPLKDEIKLDDCDYSKIHKIEDYEFYLTKALENRNEISFASLNYWDAKNAYEIVNNQYMDNMQNVELQIQRSKCQYMLNEAREDIKYQSIKIQQEVLDRHISVKSRYLDVTNTEYAVKVLEREYANAIKKNVSESELDKVLLDLETEKINHRKAIINYNTELARLEYACSVGVN